MYFCKYLFILLNFYWYFWYIKFYIVVYLIGFFIDVIVYYTRFFCFVLSKYR